MAEQREIEFKVGRRAIDGIVRISMLAPQLVQIGVSYKGERAASVVLTRSQVRAVREALAEFEADLVDDQLPAESWNSDDRRGRVLIPEKLTA